MKKEITIEEILNSLEDRIEILELNNEKTEFILKRLIDQVKEISLLLGRLEVEEDIPETHNNFQLLFNELINVEQNKIKLEELEKELEKKEDMIVLTVVGEA